MEDNNRTDLNSFIRPNISAFSASQKECDNSDNSDNRNTPNSDLKRIPSLPQLKPHFIVSEYCGRPRRESQTLYLKEKINREKAGKGDRGDRGDNEDGEKQKNKRKRNGKGLFERVAFLGGAFVGGALGLYIYSSNE